jgi:diadenosine tetraphosphate (Ap4A) HIT family hydrolase
MERVELEKRWVDAAVRIGVPQDSWNSDFKKLTSDEEGKLPEIFVYNNPRRTKRPPTQTSSDGSCVLDKEVLRAEKDGDNVIFWADDYVATPNLFPGVLGHSLYIHREHSKEIYTIDESDLKSMVRASDVTDHTVYCNLYGTGATLPYHKHFHSLPMDAPAGRLKSRPISKDVEELVGFPYEHAVFTGADSMRRTADFISDYNDALALSVRQDRITVVPFKEFTSKGFGVFEALGLFFVDAEEFKEGYEYFESKMAAKLFDKGELGLSDSL